MFAAVLASMCAADHALAQSLQRESLTGESVAAELRQINSNQPYNLALGPVQLRIETSLGVSYNDNIGLTKTDRISDFIIEPFGTLHGRWQVSDLNVLSFDIGVGYEDYAEHSRYNDVLLSPDSQAQFTFFVGDAKVDLHDVFSYEQDPTAIGQLSNQTRLSRFQNDAGLAVSWDLNDITPSISYDHANLWVTQSYYDYLTNQSDTVAPRVSVQVNDTIKAGVEGSVADTRYEKHVENNYVTETVGPFVDATISDNLSARGEFGGYFSQYERGGSIRDNEDVASYYGSGAINHRINSAFSEALTFGREFIPGLTSNFTQRTYARYSDAWQATKTINLNAAVWWENLEDSDSAFREDSNRYGTDWTLQETLSPHASFSLDYQFILKDANPSILSYYQNVGTFNFQYSF
jgi:hypothetical protein